MQTDLDWSHYWAKRIETIDKAVFFSFTDEYLESEETHIFYSTQMPSNENCDK